MLLTQEVLEQHAKNWQTCNLFGKFDAPHISRAPKILWRLVGSACLLHVERLANACKDIVNEIGTMLGQHHALTDKQLHELRQKLVRACKKNGISDAYRFAPTYGMSALTCVLASALSLTMKNLQYRNRHMVAQLTRCTHYVTNPMQEQKWQINACDEIIGNPFEQKLINQAYHTDKTVQAVAKSIHGYNTFDDMPILGDALEEAGCTDVNILNHCRKGMFNPYDSTTTHLKNCWVLRTVLNNIKW